MLKELLKEVRWLVVGVRVLRCAKNCWYEVNSHYLQERETETRSQADLEVIRIYLESHDNRKLQIGTGKNPLSGWLNTDLEPAAQNVILLDATKPFCLPTAAFDLVFSEHMIEHITYKDGLFMLAEIFRVLAPGGKVRIATPDIKHIIDLYTPEKTELQQSYLAWSGSDIMGLYKSSKGVLRRKRQEWDVPYEHIETSFPDPTNDSVCFVVNNFFRGFGHQFLYDEQTLKAAMEWVGFTAVTNCTPGQSQHEALRHLEAHGQLIGDDMNQLETMVLEATKPSWKAKD